MSNQVGILGIGTYLPSEVRRNDHWPEQVTRRWMAQRAAARTAAGRFEPTTEAMARVMKAMSEQADDPFRGAVERRVMAVDMVATDMEAAAAKDAIERAGIAAGDIDLLLVHTAVPDELLANTACPLHQRLGLARTCFSMQAESAAYSFLMQLAIAEAMIATGRARLALLVQSTAASRLLDHDDPVSPLFGDGATAVVVGPVPPSRGIVAAVHRTDGAFARSLVASVRGGRWYDEGRPVIHNADPAQDRQVFLETIDRASEVIAAVLGQAQWVAGDVAFFGSHQGTPWLRRLVQDRAGLAAARSVDTFARTGYLFSASIPLGLSIAAQDGLVAPDDRVLLFGGGTGMTYGSTVLRWGRAA